MHFVKIGLSSVIVLFSALLLSGCGNSQDKKVSLLEEILSSSEQQSSEEVKPNQNLENNSQAEQVVNEVEESSSSVSSSSSGPICSYTAFISDNDKYNSSGNPVFSGNNVSSFAAILRQDRANFYVFGSGDAADTADCMMSSKQNRARFESMMLNGTHDQTAIDKVVYGNPIVHVDLYENYIHVTVE
ncbi:MAG: hypothetical protein Q4D05_02010 [Acinetobacter sp.]|nr:hypothetical protein [Acinetobacter sp.]